MSTSTAWATGLEKPSLQTAFNFKHATKQVIATNHWDSSDPVR